MPCFKFAALLQESGWISPAYVVTDANGLIQSVTSELPQGISDHVTIYDHLALPGMVNAHSHAFQYAMAGRAEGKRVGAPADDFWTWRDLMYRLALKLDPDGFEVIASYVYSQMLCMGYTSVLEFHYVHNDVNGRPYNNPTEISQRILAAAARVGIDLTICPVFYKTSNFGVSALPEQRRFLFEDGDSYFQFLARLKRAAHSTGSKVAIGVHSLRAAPLDDVREILGDRNHHEPRHIHIAEQVGEVDACIRYHGKRPVELLLDTISIDEKWNLVHCTHVNATEVSILAKSGANVVLCPTTEGNLGDGFFPLTDFLIQGGHFSVGSDSQASLCFRKELEFLDYGQRLRSQKRGVSCIPPYQESGDALFWNSVKSGSQATTGATTAPLCPGEPLNLLLLDRARFTPSMTSDSTLLSRFIFGTDHKAIAGTICRGKLVTEFGKHREEEQLYADFRRIIDHVLGP